MPAAPPGPGLTLKCALPQLVPALEKVCGVAGAAEVLARSWRLADRYPHVFLVGTPVLVQAAVTCGLAAKLTQCDFPIRKLWLAIVERDLVPRVLEEERRMVMKLGRADLANGCV